MINNSQKRILEPFAIVLAGIMDDLNSKEDDEITEMYEACEAATDTNCWFWILRAAQFMRPVLEAEMEKRRIAPRASDVLSAPACCASFVAYGVHHEDCRNNPVRR